jgi:hypothetical protein
MCLLLAPLIIGFFSFFFFLLWPFTVLMKQTTQAARSVKQSIFLKCLWVGYISFQEISYEGKPQVVSRYILSNLCLARNPFSCQRTSLFPPERRRRRKKSFLTSPARCRDDGLEPSYEKVLDFTYDKGNSCFMQYQGSVS